MPQGRQYVEVSCPRSGHSTLAAGAQRGLGEFKGIHSTMPSKKVTIHLITEDTDERSKEMAISDDIENLTELCDEASKILGVPVDEVFEKYEGEYKIIAHLDEIFPDDDLYFEETISPAKFEYLSPEFMERLRRKLVQTRGRKKQLLPDEQIFKQPEDPGMTENERKQLLKLAKKKCQRWESIRLDMMDMGYPRRSKLYLQRWWRWMERSRLSRKRKRAQQEEDQSADSGNEDDRNQIPRMRGKSDYGDEEFTDQSSDDDYDVSRPDITVQSVQSVTLTKHGHKYTGGWKFICDKQHRHRPTDCRCIMHGRGKLQYARGGGFYDGEFHNHKKHGFGVEVDKNGKYEGHFKMGVWDGEGGWIGKTGESFKGKFHEGYYCCGRLVYEDGRTFTGKFVARTNLPLDGTMTFKQPNIYGYVKYKGELRGGSIFSGQGTLTIASGKSIKGVFVDGRIDASKEVEIHWGKPRDGLQDPYSSSLHSELSKKSGWEVEIGLGCTFQGDIDPEMLLPHGKGIFRSATTLLYQGTFERGRPRYGVIKWYKLVTHKHPLKPSENIFAREYQGPVNDYFVPSGRGLLVFNDDSVYEGDLVGGKMCGEGVYSREDGKKIIPCVGEFVDGRLVNQIPCESFEIPNEFQAANAQREWE